GQVGTLGQAAGWFRENPAVTTKVGAAGPATPPRGVADLIAGVADLSPRRGVPPGTVRVLGLQGPDGRRSWVVQIPGTQSWAPTAGRGPFDLTGDVHLVAGRRTAG